MMVMVVGGAFQVKKCPKREKRSLPLKYHKNSPNFETECTVKVK